MTGFKKDVLVRVPSETYVQIEKVAKRTGESISPLMVRIAQEWLTMQKLLKEAEDNK